MEVNSSATVLVCSQSGDFLRGMHEWLGEPVRVCLARNAVQAFERLWLDDSLIMICVDAAWPETEPAGLVARVRNSALARVSRMPVVLVTLPTADRAASQAALSALQVGADAIVQLPVLADAMPAPERQRLRQSGLAGLLRRSVGQGTPVSEVVIEAQRRRAIGLADAEVLDGGDDAALLSTLAALIRRDDECRRIGQSGIALRLRCEPQQLLSPMSRIAQGLRQSAVRDSRHWQVRLPQATYDLPG